MNIMVQNLCKSYGSSRVLDGVDVSFEQGQSYGLIGPSGSGKSTFLHMVGGLDIPDAGQIYYGDTAIDTYTIREKEHFFQTTIGFVFQFHYLLHECTVYENILIPGRIAHRPPTFCRERADELLRLVGLTDKRDAYPQALSGGQQQRVAIARALFNKPAFLLADEPTGNLDAATAMQVVDLLRDCQQAWGMGLLICSHDPHVYKAMTHLLRIHEGSVVQVS